MANDNETPIEVVRRFCAVWSNVDADEIGEFFTDDAVYHNIPMDPITGRDAIKSFIAGFAKWNASVPMIPGTIALHVIP